ncbi:CBL-interacting serine/threonine-protein kinase 1-like protein [Tanacetum coccineum]
MVVVRVSRVLCRKLKGHLCRMGYSQYWRKCGSQVASYAVQGTDVHNCRNWNGLYLTTLSFINSPVREDDVLLHTTCGSPNYKAPKILQNRGYDGATSDMWSCGVTLYVILTRYVPSLSEDAQLVPSGAKNLINRIHYPNAKTRITMEDIKTEEWFKQDYTPAVYEEEEDPMDSDKDPQSPTHINAFELIGMSSSLDISGLFEKEI